MATALVDITFIFLLIAFNAGQPQPRRSLESLEHEIAESHQRDPITLDDDIRALLAVQLRITGGR